MLTVAELREEMGSGRAQWSEFSWVRKLLVISLGSRQAGVWLMGRKIITSGSCQVSAVGPALKSAAWNFLLGRVCLQFSSSVWEVVVFCTEVRCHYLGTCWLSRLGSSVTAHTVGEVPGHCQHCKRHRIMVWSPLSCLTFLIDIKQDFKACFTMRFSFFLF